MSNKQFQLISEIFGLSPSDIANSDLLQNVNLKDRGMGALYGTGIGSTIGAGIGLPIGLLNAFKTLSRDLGPTDQHELKNATLKYIEQNKLSPTKDREKIYQFARSYSRKLSRRRFMKTVSTHTIGGATSGATFGAGVGALTGAKQIKDIFKKKQ